MKLAGAACWLVIGTAAVAEDARWYVKVDNDVAFGTDRWYSSGVRIARVSDGVELALAQDIYTPDAKRWHPGVDDRAPVARLLASGARHEWGEGYWQTIEAAIGVRGPAALGRQATSAIHHVITAPSVDWSRQLENRVDAGLAFTRSQSIASERLKVHAGATLGNQLTFAHAGFEARAGDAALSSALLRFAATPPFVPGGARGWSAYAGASVRAIARDELISRNYDPSGSELSYRRSATRIAAGVAWNQAWGALAFDLAQDSREFDAQSAPHRFGSLSIHVAF